MKPGENVHATSGIYVKFTTPVPVRTSQLIRMLYNYVGVIVKHTHNLNESVTICESKNTMLKVLIQTPRFLR